MAVRDTIINGRMNWNIKDEGPTYFKIREAKTLMTAALGLEIGFRKESPIRPWSSSTPHCAASCRLIRWTGCSMKNLAKFTDDIQSSASRYVQQYS